MNLKPVKHYEPPAYPTQDVLLAHPELLRLIPQRWQGCSRVLSVLGATALLISSAQTSAVNQHVSVKPSHRIAPIFAHGNGSGSGGGGRGDNSFYFSEAEAFKVIQDEAAKAGIAFEPKAKTLPKVRIPYTYTSLLILEQLREQTCTTGTLDDSLSHMQDLVLDGYDQKHRIAFEFISLEQYINWNHPIQTRHGTVTGNDLKTTAQQLQISLSEQDPDCYAGIFYDPVKYRVLVQNDTLLMSSQEQSEKQLRLQVRDFIQWLKSEGVI